MPLARKVGILLLGCLVIGLSVVAGTWLGATLAHADHNSAAVALHGTTDGWFNGETTTYFYHKPFFSAQPPTSAAASRC